MKFEKYTSTENSYREKYIAILRSYRFDKVSWVAHEKIDGANFSFITDGKIVAVASRNDLTNGDFYHCQNIIELYTEKVLRLKQNHFNDAKQIQVYGELFGPGIQRKVFYGDEKEYMAFEIQVDGVVVDADVAADLLASAGIPMPPAFGIFQSLDEALKLPNVFTSRVLDELYPGSVCQYELGENDAEGLVLKPVVPLYLPNGSRVIVKNKNPKFAEKKRKKKTPGEPNPWIDVVDQYVNLNRLNAVLSKEGSLEPKDFGRIIRLMSNDVIDDMIKDGDLPADWKKTDARNTAGKAVTTVVSAFLKTNLLPKL